MSSRVGLSVALVVAVICVAPAAAYAGEGDYISLFAGAWSGSGTVLNDEKPWQVNCQAVGQPGMNHLTIKGSCSVFLVKVNIAAEVTYDPQSGRYDGTYTGGDMAANISGKRSGDTVDFTMTWVKPINGDVHARLTIVNAGTGYLRIVIDNLKPNDLEERASDIRLSQK